MGAEPPAELDALAHAVIGAAIEVHRELGPGFSESVYANALAVELDLRRLPFEREPQVEVRYKGTAVGRGRPDLVVGGELVVELKVVDALIGVHRAQVLSYLKATGFRLGLLFNFRVPLMKNGIERVIWSGCRSSGGVEP